MGNAHGPPCRLSPGLKGSHIVRGFCDPLRVMALSCFLIRGRCPRAIICDRFAVIRRQLRRLGGVALRLPLKRHFRNRCIRIRAVVNRFDDELHPTRLH